MSEQSIEFTASLLKDNGASLELSQEHWLKERQQEARSQLENNSLPSTINHENFGKLTIDNLMINYPVIFE